VVHPSMGSSGLIMKPMNDQILLKTYSGPMSAVKMKRLIFELLIDKQYH